MKDKHIGYFLLSILTLLYLYFMVWIVIDLFGDLDDAFFSIVYPLKIDPLAVPTAAMVVLISTASSFLIYRSIVNL